MIAGAMPPVIVGNGRTHAIRRILDPEHDRIGMRRLKHIDQDFVRNLENIVFDQPGDPSRHANQSRLKASAMIFRQSGSNLDDYGYPGPGIRTALRGHGGIGPVPSAGAALFPVAALDCPWQPRRNRRENGGSARMSSRLLTPIALPFHNR